MVKFLKLSFSGKSTYHWNGTITNQKIDSSQEKKSKLSLIQVKEIDDFPTEVIVGKVMFGGFQLKCLKWGISINPTNFLNTEHLKIHINESNLTIIGSVLVRVNIKEECLLDLENNLDKIYVSEAQIWNAESYNIRNSYLFTITGNWTEDVKFQDAVLNGSHSLDRFVNIELLAKKPTGSRG